MKYILPVRSHVIPDKFFIMRIVEDKSTDYYQWDGNGWSVSDLILVTREESGDLIKQLSQIDHYDVVKI